MDTNQKPKEEVKNPQKRETFEQTILALVKDSTTPIPREELVELAIKRNKPTSERPQWVYHSVIKKAAKKGLIIISEDRLRNHQKVSKA